LSPEGARFCIADALARLEKAFDAFVCEDSALGKSRITLDDEVLTLLLVTRLGEVDQGHANRGVSGPLSDSAAALAK